MDELMNRVSEFINSVSDEDIEKMSSSERKEFIDSMEKLEARIEVMKEMMEGGEL